MINPLQDAICANLQELFMNLICLKCARAACTCGLLACLTASATPHGFSEEQLPSTAAVAGHNSAATSHIVPDTVADGTYSTLPYMEPLTRGLGDDESPFFVLTP